MSETRRAATRCFDEIADLQRRLVIGSGLIRQGLPSMTLSQVRPLFGNETIHTGWRFIQR